MQCQFQEEPPKMKLGIPPPWSNTMFDVFLMNIAASAHGVYCWVIHVFGTWFSYEWWKSSKSKIFQCNVSFKGNITTQNRVGHYSTMVYNIMFDVFLIDYCSLGKWYDIVIFHFGYMNFICQVVLTITIKIKLHIIQVWFQFQGEPTKIKLVLTPPWTFTVFFYVRVWVFRFKTNHSNYVCIWNGHCILRI